MLCDQRWMKSWISDGGSHHVCSVGDHGSNGAKICQGVEVMIWIQVQCLLDVLGDRLVSRGIVGVPPLVQGCPVCEVII